MTFRVSSPQQYLRYGMRCKSPVDDAGDPPISRKSIVKPGRSFKLHHKPPTILFIIVLYCDDSTRLRNVCASHESSPPVGWHKDSQFTTGIETIQSQLSSSWNSVPRIHLPPEVLANGGLRFGKGSVISVLPIVESCYICNPPALRLVFFVVVPPLRLEKPATLKQSDRADTS